MKPSIIKSIVLAIIIVLTAAAFQWGDLYPFKIPRDSDQLTSSSAIPGVDTKADRVLGNPEAELYIIEYSDIISPRGQEYHPVITRVLQQLENEGDVARVFRYLPLRGSNSSAMILTAECAGDLAHSDEAFWQVIYPLYESNITLENQDEIQYSELLELAAETGANRDEIDNCIKEKQEYYETEVTLNNQRQFRRTEAAGIPFIVLDTGQNRSFPEPAREKIEQINQETDIRIWISDTEDQVHVEGNINYHTLNRLIDTVLGYQ